MVAGVAILLFFLGVLLVIATSYAMKKPSSESYYASPVNSSATVNLQQCSDSEMLAHPRDCQAIEQELRKQRPETAM
jgi:hypothetical protein